MAVVGHAEIIVKAITKGVKDDIKRGLSEASKEIEQTSDDVGKKINKGLRNGMGGNDPFKKWAKDAQQTSKKFHEAIRSSYKWQAASGVLLQSIMALGGGILALAGNMAGAAASGAALFGTMVQIKVAALVGKQAFHGIMAAVKQSDKASGEAGKTLRELREEMQQLAFAAEEAALGEEGAAMKLEKAREALSRVQNLPPDNRARREAELAYKQADLAYRQAKDKAADLQEQIANPPKKKDKAGDDPYKDLTETQKKFAIYLKSVMPKMKELREAAASSFLPELTKQMQTMFKGGFFQMLVKGFRDVSKGLAEATSGFAGTLFDPKNKQNMAELFKNSATTVGTLGGTLGKAFGGFITLMRALQPLIGRFTLFLDSKADAFGSNMQSNFSNIVGFFKQAGDAAAGWGAILGRLFEKFKGMIKANVGPGTGGQLLLDFFNQGQTGFKGMDDAAGEFARKQHFLAAATNLKAMLDSIGKIFGFLSDIGTDPAVASFWDKLSELEGPLGEIFESITGSSDEFANLIVTLVEMIATFADAGQLRAFMTLLSGLAKLAGAVFRTFQPLMQVLGPLIGVIGALLVAKKSLIFVTKVLGGTFMSLAKIGGWLTRVTKGLILANQMQMAQETLSMRLKRALIMLTTAEGRAKLKSGLQTIFTAGASQRAAQADAQAAIAKAAATGATVAQTTVTTAAIGPTMAFSAAVNSAIWPLTLIVLAIAAVIAVVIALVSWFNQIKADNVKKAQKEMDKSFASTRGKIIGATDAQEQWTAALLSVRDDQKSGIESIKDVGKALDGSGDKTNNAKEAMNAYAGSLAKVFKKSLPEGQRQFRNMVYQGRISEKATRDLILANEDMIKSLEKQAKAMGDTIMNADGTVNAVKAVDYAIGEGAAAVRKATIEQQKFAATYKNAVKTFIDNSDAIQKATKDNKFDLDVYKKELEGQAKALTNWQANISKLNATMTNKKVLQNLIGQGAAGANLVKSLAEGGTEAIQKYESAWAAAAEAKENANLFADAYGSTTAVENIVKSIYKTSDRQLSRLQEAISSGAGAFEIAAKFGISEEQILAEQKRIASAVDEAQTVDIKASWNQDSLDDAKKQLDDHMGVQNWVIRTGENNQKDGGLITRANGGIIGAVQRFADGYSGRVSGPGTARSDQIPAMISNGEFVMNARATAANLDLLNAMNSNKNVSGMAGNQVGITINAAPGMDPTQIAKAVAAELDNQLSRGSSI